MSLSLFLVLLSGICWTVVYIDMVRLGFKDKTYGMPLFALSLNLAWELLHTINGYMTAGIKPQVVINGVWFLFDLLILYTFFAYGKKYFPKQLNPKFFVPWALLVLATGLLVQKSLVLEIGIVKAAVYAAFLQNLLMSVLFIDMLSRRNSKEGQSLTIAVNKCIGTLAPTILFGIIGAKVMNNIPSLLVLITGSFCFVFDLVYIYLLVSKKENHE